MSDELVTFTTGDAMALNRLPTDPFTVIRVHYFDPPWDSELMLLPDGQWWTPGATSPARAETLPLYITEFEVIAKPADPDHFEAEDPISARVRRETAKAVLDRASDFMSMDEQALVAGEFGIKYDL